MKYLDKSFTVTPGTSDKYRENYDRVFGKKKVGAEADEAKATEEAAAKAVCSCACHKDKSVRHEQGRAGCCDKAVFDY